VRIQSSKLSKEKRFVEPLTDAAGDCLCTEGIMAEMLWTPSPARVAGTNLSRFIRFVNARRKKDFREYDELYRWSVESIGDFWADLWEFAGIRTSRIYEEIVDDPRRCPVPAGFPGRA